jgi:hypothetical protein
MARVQVFRALLLASGALLIGACATQPASTSTAQPSLDDRYFEREARNFSKFEHEGQVIYCQSIKNVTSLIPHKRCLTETALRQRVEQARRERNAVPAPLVAGTGQGSIG